jgi:hypothetical protein
MIPVLALILILCVCSPVFSQTIKSLGELPKSEFAINIYQVYGYHQGPEGFKVVYLDPENEPKVLYLPIAMRSSYRILRPQEATYNNNFLIVWKKGESVERVEWYMPRAVDWRLPNFINGPFEEEDLQAFDQVVQNGELMLEVEGGGTQPIITAPGGN